MPNARRDRAALTILIGAVIGSLYPFHPSARVRLA
jgi:hypothetical protein